MNEATLILAIVAIVGTFFGVILQWLGYKATQKVARESIDELHSRLSKPRIRVYPSRVRSGEQIEIDIELHREHFKDTAPCDVQCRVVDPKGNAFGTTLRREVRSRLGKKLYFPNDFNAPETYPIGAYEVSLIADEGRVELPDMAVFEVLDYR